MKLLFGFNISLHEFTFIDKIKPSTLKWYQNGASRLIVSWIAQNTLEIKQASKYKFIVGLVAWN